VSGLASLWAGPAGGPAATWGLALFLALLGGLAVSAAGGRRPAPEAGGLGARTARFAEGAVPAAAAGLVAFHLLLLGYDLAGVDWRRRTLAAGLAALAAAAALAAWRVRRAARADVPPELEPPADPPGWADGVALLCLGVFAAAASSLRATIPDFVYHWGLKAKRYHLAGGIDWAWLADPLALTEHPDYPSLVPGLYAATAHLRGYFDERALLAWSVVFFALCVLAARRALAAGAGGRAVRRAGLALVAAALATFGVGYEMAGSADWLLALAVLAALPALLAPGHAAEPAAGGDPAAGDLEVGLAAALAAGAKIEGVALAALLVAARLARPGGPAGGPWRGRLRRLPRLALPPALVVGPWLAGNLRHGLFQPDNTGSWDAARIEVVARAVVEALGTAEWYGLPWLLLALPALLAVRRTRAAGAVVALQLAFYLGVYLTAPVDTRLYVLSSFPRLLFQLLPGLLVALVALLAPPAAEVVAPRLKGSQLSGGKAPVSN